MVNYHLRLISYNKPNTPDLIHSSNQMIGWGVWSEFSKLNHVSLHYYESDFIDDISPVEWKTGVSNMDEVDFTLIHSYIPGPIFSEMEVVRSKTKHQVLWISECPFPGMDYCFTFLPSSIPNSEQIPLPTPTNILDASLIEVQKLPRSILLDHAWGWEPGYDNFDGDPPNLWIKRFYEWFKDYDGIVGQMESPINEKMSNIVIPDWIKKVPNSFYEEYLKCTASFENFVMTHPGSYEHSIIDMAARGIRVLVPTPTVPHYHKEGWAIQRGGDPFAPFDTIKRLNLETFSSKEELLSILKTPIKEVDKSKFTSMAEVVRKIDAHCQRVLSEHNK